MNCELTHLEREPIDVARATGQHARYEDMLRSLGCDVRRLATLDDHPDSVFVEDTAIILDEIAVMARPGAESRRGETTDVAEALRPLRKLHFIGEPGTLDGGDVLRWRRILYVGASSRSNEDGARQLADAVGAHGYSVRRVPLRDCLHLKSAASTLPDERWLIDPRCVDAANFEATALHVPEEEPQGANVLVVGDVVIAPSSAPLTRELLEREGYSVATVDASELAKAEAGLTCCSLIVS